MAANFSISIFFKLLQIALPAMPLDPKTTNLSFVEIKAINLISININLYINNNNIII